jgi:hypothetical protein
MGAIQPLEHHLRQQRLRPEARTESDAPEVWPEMDTLVRGTEHLKKIMTQLSRPFHHDCC